MRNFFKMFVFFIGGRPLMFPGLSVRAMWSPKCMEENEEETKEKETEPDNP